MKLPAAIEAYFNAAKVAAAAAPIDAFTPDAVVKDEGKTHAGRAAIGAWWGAATALYQHTAEPCDIREDGGVSIVRARVTGTFPGSPALLTFGFRLQGGRIAALDIGA